jgi:hypothetical protein
LGGVARNSETLCGHFDETQEGTLHFCYLTEGSLLTISAGFDEHLRELAQAIHRKVIRRGKLVRSIPEEDWREAKRKLSCT